MSIVLKFIQVRISNLVKLKKNFHNELERIKKVINLSKKTRNRSTCWSWIGLSNYKNLN